MQHVVASASASFSSDGSLAILDLDLGPRFEWIGRSAVRAALWVLDGSSIAVACESHPARILALALEHAGRRPSYGDQPGGLHG